MKKLILGFCLIAMLASCGSKNEQWEYKVVKVAGHDAEIAAHPTNPVECCADANPKTMLPNDT